LAMSTHMSAGPGGRASFCRRNSATLCYDRPWKQVKKRTQTQPMRSNNVNGRMQKNIAAFPASYRSGVHQR